MDRVFESGAAGSPPSLPVAPSTGYATKGNPATSVPATKPGQWWYHMVTEELRAVIAASGQTPDYTNVGQLVSAIQALISAGGIKYPARAATVANIASLAGGAPNTLDGVTLAANDRVLVKDQTTGSQNGLYVVTTLGTGSNGTWTRATDADGAGELFAGVVVMVSEGSANADSLWELTNDGAITIGSTALVFARKDGSQMRQIQGITASVAANALTVGLNAGSLDFRSSSLTNGVPNTRSFSAISLVVPSGATLGTTSGQAARLALLAIDNAGTIELAISNLAGGVNLDETTLISTTAISAGATSASVIYSTTARTNVPFRVVGFIDITEATAGTWATAATTLQGEGGQALSAMQSLGYSQSWQNVTGSRALSTTYYNTTGRPIGLILNPSASSSATTFNINGVQVYQNSYGVVELVIPPGASYTLTAVGGGAIGSWFELR